MKKRLDEETARYDKTDLRLSGGPYMDYVSLEIMNGRIRLPVVTPRDVAAKLGDDAFYLLQRDVVDAQRALKERYEAEFAEIGAIIDTLLKGKLAEYATAHAGLMDAMARKALNGK